MKQTIPPCGVVAAAGTAEMMQAILLVLRDVQDFAQQTGSALRITQAQSVTQIRQRLAPAGAAAVPELVIFAMSQKDAACMDDLLLTAGKNPRTQILLLTGREMYAQTAYRCRKYPIYVLTLPLKRQVLAEMLRMYLTMRSRLLEKEADLQRLRKKMNEITIVTKAKCLLIQERQMTEEGAHYYLEKRAMDDGQTKLEVAAAIIRMYS